MASFDLGIRIKKKRVNFLIQKVFKLILLYQLQVKTDFFLQQSLSRYKLMRVSFCMHQKFYQTSVEPCQNSKV